jgi:hypothetical protein
LGGYDPASWQEWLFMLVRISDDVVYRELAGESVLLNLTSGIYFGLDEVGTRIWYLLAEHRDSEKIIPMLIAEYDVGEAQLRRDVAGLIAQLSEQGLLVID